LENKVSAKKIAFSIVLLIFGMCMLTLASVPIYNLFCKVTGYGGTTRYSKINSQKIGSKNIKVRFDANVDSKLPWLFKPEQSEIDVRVGENNLVFYYTENLTDSSIIGTAVYNVTPYKAAKYFNKIQCFCFEEQLLKARQKVIMPVSFFIDAAIEDDENLKDVDTITLSYTFYSVR
jgi:cytochrome c oxidase assembly protein subunit 11